MAKFLKESQSINTDDTYASSQNCILWRYAELLLDMAEIEFLRGRTGDALDKVNQIRRRVKMPELQSLTWDDIMNERRVELAFEKSTYWDVLRYGKAETVMTGTTNPLFGVKIVYNSSVSHGKSAVSVFCKRIGIGDRILRTECKRFASLGVPYRSNSVGSVKGGFHAQFKLLVGRRRKYSDPGNSKAA